MSDNMQLFCDLYTEDLLRVDWDKSDIKLSISRAISPEIDEQIDKSVIHSFMHYITEIMDYVTKENVEKSEVIRQLEELMGEEFDAIVSEAERKASLIEPTIESLDIEILTKRGFKDVKKILGYNVKLKFNLDSDQSFSFEL